jgi:hypothetical protein
LLGHLINIPSLVLLLAVKLLLRLGPAMLLFILFVLIGKGC